MRNAIRNQGARQAVAIGLIVCSFLVGGAAAGTSDPSVYDRQSLRLNVWVDKGDDEVYSRGELLDVTFQTNEDAYVVVYHVDIEGRVAVLWPTSRFSDGFVFGDHEYAVPAAGSRRLRTAEVEGVGYVAGIASRYPFDLRDVDIDFHHEVEDPAHDFYVAGDPFLAMNEVNFALTGLEDPGEFVVTNYATYYVHRQVDHPRYLCSQCHLNEEIAQHPYDSACTITIRHDYGWSNVWWDRFGYYPAYYYPVYYYVDPWYGSPWVQYWYRPWYSWPGIDIYDWGYACYDWRYSPYWRGDCDDAHGRGERRYRSLEKPDHLRDGRTSDTVSSRVTGARPDSERLTAMKTRTVVRDQRAVGQRAEVRRDQIVGGVTARNVAPAARSQSKFTRSPGDRPAAPGLRVPSRSSDGAVRRGDASPGVRRTEEGRIKPVEPRDGSSPTWSGRRGTSPRETEPARPVERPRGNTRSRVEKKSSGERVEPAAPPPRQPAPARGAGENRRDGGEGDRGVESGRSGRGTTPAQPTAPSSPGSSSGRDSGRGGTTRGGRG